MKIEKELNDEHTMDICLIKVNNSLYEIAVDENEEVVYLVEPYVMPIESKEQLTFTQALWYHNLLLNDDTIITVPAFGLWIPRDEFIDFIDFHNINK